MRPQFGDYLLKFRYLPIKAENRAENTKTVILLDDRMDFWTICVLKNFRYFLDDTWNFHVVCTDRNMGWMQQTLAQNGWKIAIHNIREYMPEYTSPTLDLETYIRFYTTPEILESFTEETLLTIQMDSVALNPIQDKWLEFAFIGAPCGNRAMNGGCTIRSRKAMLDILYLHEIPSNCIDDVWYTEKMRELNLKMPTEQEAAEFAVENFLIQDSKPFGFHGTNKYYVNDEIVGKTLEYAAPVTLRKPRVMISSPVYKWPPHPKFVESLKRCEEDPRFDVEFRSIQGDAHIERARSMLLLQYLTCPTPCDWYVMIDSDIEFNGDIIWGLINRGKDVIGAAYAFKSPEGTPKFQQPVIRAIDGEQPTSDGLVKVRHLGGGFTVVSDSFIRKMCDHYRDEEFCMNPDLLSGKDHQMTYGLWNPVYIDQPHWGTKPDGTYYREMLSEDYSFCERIQLMGQDIWLDLNCYIAHWDGDKCYQLKLSSQENNG